MTALLYLLRTLVDTQQRYQWRRGAKMAERFHWVCVNRTASDQGLAVGQTSKTNLAIGGGMCGFRHSLLMAAMQTAMGTIGAEFFCSGDDLGAGVFILRDLVAVLAGLLFLRDVLGSRQ